MISKERLQELIDKKATIWADAYGKIQLCDKSEVCDTIAFTGNHQIQEGYCLCGFVYNNEFIRDNIEPDGLEEDVEKGEWQYEMHASRLERFAPPVWEEIQYTKHYFVYKFSIKENYDFFGRITILKDFNIKVSGLVQGVLFEEYFNEAASKDNYIKACTIARKLFLGEGVDGI